MQMLMLLLKQMPFLATDLFLIFTFVGYALMFVHLCVLMVWNLNFSVCSTGLIWFFLLLVKELFGLSKLWLKRGSSMNGFALIP